MKNRSYLSYMLILTQLLILSACTISFSNISTKGTATDVLDENQDASPTVSPDITIPTSLVP